MSSNPRFAVVASFRERGYSAGDVADLLEAFAEIGPVELKPLWLPEAGGSWELWLNAKAIVEGLEAAVLYDMLKTVTSTAILWMRRRRQSGKFEPELSAVESSNERLRVSVRTAEGDTPLEVATAQQIVGRLPSELPQTVLLERDIRLIVIEVPPTGSPSPVRWLVGMSSQTPTHEYDPERHRFTVLPPERPGDQDA